jgi:hypothetical protein
VWYGNASVGSGMWTLNTNTSQWTLLIPKAQLRPDCPDCPYPEAVMTWDGKNDVLIAVLNSTLYAYRFQTNAWQTIRQGTFSATDATGSFVYDRFNAINLLYTDHSPGLTLYDYAADSLFSVTPRGDALNTADRGMCYFDEQYQVFVMYWQTSSTPYVYRYKLPVDTTAVTDTVLSAGAGSAAFQISPNPLKHGGSVSFTTAQTRHISLSLYDLRGRVLSEADHGSLQAGAHRLKFTLPQGLTSGIYFIRLKTGSKTTVSKVLINH